MSSEDGYQVRIWHRGWGDWAWEVREAGLFSQPFKSGSGSNRRDARDAAALAAEAHRERATAMWRPLRLGSDRS